MRVILNVTVAFFTTLCMLSLAPAWGDVASVLVAEQRAIARMQLAARQRYFVQKVAKSGCYALSVHNPQENAQQALETMARFDENSEILIAGDAELDLGPENDAATLQAIAAARPNWLTFSAATRQIISGDWHAVPMAQVLHLNTIVLMEIDAAVDQIVETHSRDLATQKKYAATIDVAGRQRTLIQKAAKEVCFIALDIDKDRMRATLAETIETFEVSLHALENGNYDMSVIDPPSLAVLGKISEIRTLWNNFRATIEKSAQGADPTFDEVAFVERTNGPLYELSNELVQLYVKK